MKNCNNYSPYALVEAFAGNTEAADVNVKSFAPNQYIASLIWCRFETKMPESVDNVSNLDVPKSIQVVVTRKAINDLKRHLIVDVMTVCLA